MKALVLFALVVAGVGYWYCEYRKFQQRVDQRWTPQDDADTAEHVARMMNHR